MIGTGVNGGGLTRAEVIQPVAAIEILLGILSIVDAPFSRITSVPEPRKRWKDDSAPMCGDE